MNCTGGKCPGQQTVTHATDNALPIDAAGAASPLSLLISRYTFQEGEIIQLAIRPSAWWILFSSWQVVLLAAVVALAGITFADYLPGRRSVYIEVGLMAGLARLMWATTKWMSRIHVLTNMRAMTISGVFNVTVTECPLRRLARVRAITPLREKLLMLGSLELIPMDEHFSIILWQTIRHPAEVQRKIRAAIERANQGTLPPG